MIPQEQQQYIVQDPSIGDSIHITSLKVEKAPIPLPSQYEVLVRIHAVSLNHRDVSIATGTYKGKVLSVRNGVVPCSDGAGEVVAIGDKVTRFQVGQRVMANFNPSHVQGRITEEDLPHMLGGAADGLLREYAVLPEDGLVVIPDYLTMEEASTLPCAGVTAWNALMGWATRLRAGEVVLTQGTGGVSVFAAQIAVAAGAEVIGTTSSTDKAATLKAIGVSHVINYRKTPEWGSEARRLANGGHGVDHVIEIGGSGTMEESLKAVRLDGSIAVVGRVTDLTGSGSQRALLLTEAFDSPRAIRRIMVGSRDQFQELADFFDRHQIHPIIDQEIFSFDRATQAFEYLWSQKHIGNVVIRVVSS